jgi:hypothetical protein
VVSIMLWPRKFVFYMSVFLVCMATEKSPSMTDRMTITRIQSLTLLPKTYIHFNDIIQWWNNVKLVDKLQRT